MTGLAEGQGGVYRVLAPAESVTSEGPAQSPESVEAELSADGWRVAALPEVERTEEFYAALRTALGLPDWTGANLDALWDVLTDLREPTALVWHHHATYAVARPERWRRILAVLEERAAQEPPFALVLT